MVYCRWMASPIRVIHQQHQKLLVAERYAFACMSAKVLDLYPDETDSPCLMHEAISNYDCPHLVVEEVSRTRSGVPTEGS